MKRLEALPEIASRQLGGLKADASLLGKIKINASDIKPAKRRPVWQPVLAACAAIVFCAGAVGAAVWGMGDGAVTSESLVASDSMLESHAAGDYAAPSEAPRIAADVPKNSVTMRAGSRDSTGTLFATGEGDSFPLITVSGATYRMLTSPSGISASLLGDELGEVGEFNVEPALGTSDIVSNAAAVNSKVYAVSGMEGAMIAAEVSGQTRVFQRVSYAGTAIIGGESLSDTLCAAGDATALRLSDVGEVTDADTVRALVTTLLDKSDYRGTGMSGEGSLQIDLSNGLTLQLFAGDDTVSACGTWDCPDFFEAFHEAVGR